MKLRNLMYATMIACAFASCSKDDAEIVGPDGPEAQGDATIEVKIAGPTTKADVMSTTDEAIKSLALVIFDTTGKVEVVGTDTGAADKSAVAGASQKSVKAGSIKAGAKQILVLANVNDLVGAGKAIVAGKTKAEVFTALRELGSETATNGFSMNSALIDVTAKASTTTYVGYTPSQDNAPAENDEKAFFQRVDSKIPLYRNVARVELSSVALSSNIVGTQYPNAQLLVKRVFILHGHAKSTVAGKDGKQWGVIDWAYLLQQAGINYYNGASKTEYASWVTYMTTVNDKGENLKKVYNFIPTTAANSYEVWSGDDYSYSFAENTASVTQSPKSFYVYESNEGTAVDGTAYCTMLVVEAKFSYTDQDNKRIGEDRFYPVAIGYNGASFSDVTGKDDFKDLREGTLEGALRNLKYTVALTIKGPGYYTPFGPKPEGETDPDDPNNPSGGDTFMDALVRVVDFATVTQAPDIE